MIRLFICNALILILFSALPVKAQDFIENSSLTGVCYAGNKTNRIYIPPPDKFLNKGSSRGGGSITINYTGFPTQAIAALEFAASILEEMLPADTKITILARWENISTEGVLGHSRITGYAGGWAIDALNPFAYYPAALAEKIAGLSLNDDLQGDIELTINSSRNWYLGIDGNTPVLAYDLVTVVLHEICHGLGFFDSMGTDATSGYYGIGSIPMIYDTFVESVSGDRLTDTSKYFNFSTELRQQLTSENLYFNGVLLNNFTSGSRARLYVPKKWDDGSSVSHLDEELTEEPNTLMTPFIDMGEAIHNPGDLTFSILGDLGWVNTRIVHDPIGDTEENLSEIVLSTLIESDTLYNRDNVGVVFSYDNFENSDTLFMTSVSSDDNFTANITIPSYNTEVQYYFFVEDYFQRLYRSPSFFEYVRYKVFVGADTIKPVIIHTPIDYFLETEESLSFLANVSDNRAIDTVYVEYNIDDGQPQYIGMETGTSDLYSATINSLTLLSNGGDSIHYRIFAVDSALISNTAVLPESGYLSFKIEHIGSTLANYSTDFTNSSDDFFNVGFEIIQPGGFSGKALHTKHPYESPEDNDKTLDFISILRHPIKLDESGLVINFKEIVLVEPGEPGSVYGSDDFYDYVILEGSNDFGRNWSRLSDGYDSRYFSTWEANYNSSIVGMNSIYPGTEAMLRSHSLFYRPSDIFAVGDTILFRFRLFSDPFANGWGWVIDDLQISPLVDAIEDVRHDPVYIYPNPGQGLIRINKGDSDNYSSKPVRYNIFNSMGICVVSDFITTDSDTVADISRFPAGMYIIVLYRDDGIMTFKYYLIR